MAYRVLTAFHAAGVVVSALKRKAAAYDAIARAYGIGTCESNVDRCVTVATHARELRDKAMRTRDIAVDAGIVLRARVKELEGLAYIGDHHFPDLTYKARFEEALADLGRARLAAQVAFADLREIAAACGQRDDEYYREAIERRLAELTAAANELPGLTATLDELFHVLESVRGWLAVHFRATPSFERQMLASILDSAPKPPAARNGS